MKNVYFAPQVDLLDLTVEGQVMLTQSEFDEKHNNEYLEWDDAVEL